MTAKKKFKPKAVMFDFGDTLVETTPSYLERMRMAFEAEGLKFSFGEIEKAYIEGDWRSAKALIDRKPFPREAWQELFMAIMLETLHVATRKPSFIQKIADRMATIVPSRHLIPGVMEFLVLCKKNKIEMAIISNNDGSTAKKAGDVGILEFFDAIVDSTIEKTPKPDPKLFEITLAKMKSEAKQCLHVGDLLGCDVLGGQSAGIATAWFNQREYTPKSDIVPDIEFREYAELAERLGFK